MTPAGRRERVADLCVLGAALFVAAVYVACAIVLIRYPWDWSPDEGLSLDYARRVAHAPWTLYTQTAVPFPCAYTPLLFVLLAPVVWLSSEPLGPARVIALAWTLAAVGVVFALVRRVGGLPAAAATAALALCPFDLTFWSMLVRVDGLMLALWLAAALPLLPASLTRGADRLTHGRIAAGALLLLLAVLTKPTAVALGAPLVLAWLLVDARSAARLAAAMVVFGVTIVFVLDRLTSGGFLWTMGLWRTHGTIPGQTSLMLGYFLRHAAPVLVVAVVGVVVAARAGAKPWRDASLMLVAGGLLVIPTLSKGGAMWTYLLPLLAGITVFAGRSLANSRLGVPLMAGLAVVLAVTRVFPLPSPRDEETARAFYGFVQGVSAAQSGPMLVARPDYASFVIGQSVELEASSFPYLAHARVAGTERILERLDALTYTLVVEGQFFPPPFGGYRESMDRGYLRLGGCLMPSAIGSVPQIFYMPKGRAIPFNPKEGIACSALAGR